MAIYMGMEMMTTWLITEYWLSCVVATRMGTFPHRSSYYYPFPIVHRSCYPLVMYLYSYGSPLRRGMRAEANQGCSTRAARREPSRNRGAPAYLLRLEALSD